MRRSVCATENIAGRRHASGLWPSSLSHPLLFTTNGPTQPRAPFSIVTTGECRDIFEVFSIHSKALEFLFKAALAGRRLGSRKKMIIVSPPAHMQDVELSPPLSDEKLHCIMRPAKAHTKAHRARLFGAHNKSLSALSLDQEYENTQSSKNWPRSPLAHHVFSCEPIRARSKSE